MFDGSHGLGVPMALFPCRVYKQSTTYNIVYKCFKAAVDRFLIILSGVDRNVEMSLQSNHDLNECRADGESGLPTPAPNY